MSQQVHYLNNMDAPPEAPKKRMRTLRSCLMCRKKKTRCDKTKPVCAACIKRNEGHLCQYGDIRWDIKISKTGEGDSTKTSPGHSTPLPQSQNVSQAQQSQPQSQSQSAKCFINKIVSGSNTQVILDPANSSARIPQVTIIKETPPATSTSNTTPTTATTVVPNSNYKTDIIDFNKIPLPTPGTFDHFGTLTWSVITKKDLYVHVIISSQNPKTALLNTSKDFELRNSEFFQKWEQQNPELFNTNLLKRGKQVYSTGSLFVLHLKEFFKDVRLCWYLVDVFFETELCVYLPFLDKLEFKHQLSKILLKDGLNIQVTGDLSIAGLLLLIMKLAHFFITFNYGKEFNMNEFSNVQEEKLQYIFDHPLRFDVVHLIRRIQKELIELKPYSIEAFQFLLMRYYYDVYAPEECGCVYLPLSEQISSLWHYANLLSLNRDPELVLGYKSPARNDLHRRLWYGLILLDNRQNLLLGLSKTISESSYDTALPGEGNLKINEEDEIEILKNEYIVRQLKYHSISQPLVDMIVSIKNPSNFEKLEKIVKDLNEFLNTKIRPLESMKLTDSITERLENFHNLQEKIHSELLLFMVYHQLFIHFSMRQNRILAIKYLLKLCEINKQFLSYIPLVSTSNDPTKNPRRLFGSGIFIFTLIENGSHKFSLFMMSILGRIKSLKLLIMTDIPLEISLLIDKILRTSYYLLETLWSKSIHISSTYFHPWMTSKIHRSLFQKCLTMPLGQTYSMEKTIVDINIISTLNKYKGYDFGFSLFGLDEFQSLCQEFDGLYEALANESSQPFENTNIDTSSRRSSSNIDSSNSQFNDSQGPYNNYMVDYDASSWNDKRWFDKMLSEFSESPPANSPDLVNNLNFNHSHSHINTGSPYYYGNNTPPSAVFQTHDETASPSRCILNGNNGRPWLFFNDSGTFPQQ